MKVVIPGGSGQVGTCLARAFHADGHDVVVLSRTPRPEPWRVVGWDGATLGDWRREIDDSDIVINLAGAASTAATRRPTGARSWSRACCRRRRLARRSRRQPHRPGCGCRRAPRRFTRTATTAVLRVPRVAASSNARSHARATSMLKRHDEGAFGSSPPSTPQRSSFAAHDLCRQWQLAREVERAAA